jgi:hypothetical protein
MKKFHLYVLCAFFAAFCMAMIPPQREAQSSQETPPREFGIGDFESRYELDASLEGRIYRVRLTPEVFRGVRRSYRQDLAVFDAEGNPLPFLTRDVAVPYSADVGPDDGAAHGDKRERIPFFTLPGAARAESPMTGVTVRTGNYGQIIDIRNDGVPKPAEADGRFLIDLSGLTEISGDRTAGYRLEIELGGEDDVMTHAEVYASDNLKDWRAAAERAPIIRLRSGENTLSSAFIEIASGPAKYMMLALNEPVPVSGMFISVMERRETVTIEDDSSAFAGRRETDGTAFIYDTWGAFPVRRVNFVLREPGIFKASVSSRSSGDWLSHGGMELSFIKNDSGERRNEAIQIRETGGRYWRLETRGSLPSVPEMRVYWRPKELVFMAQGKGPYILAFGCKEPLVPLSNPGLMESAIEGIDAGDILEAGITGAASAVSVTPPPEENAAVESKWPQYMVWAVLTASALLLSWMAWRLIILYRR